MLILDLKLTLFLILLLAAAAIWGAVRWGQHRSAAPTGLAPTLELAPFGLALLEGTQVRYANACARRLLELPAVSGSLPDAPWLDVLESDRTAARADGRGAGRYRTVPAQPATPFATGERVIRWWVAPAGPQDLLFLLDITAQQETEEAARYLIHDLSHELRTPIATILTHSEILGLSDLSEELRAQSLRLLKEETQRMARLVNDMLELGRLEMSVELVRRPLDLLALAEEVVLQSTPRAAERGIALTLEAEDPLPPVLGDADRLKQVFLNLLDNIFKYCRPGDRAMISLRGGFGGVVCTVRDTGPGIPARHLPHVARRFYRAAPKDVPGSGLGLSLVAEILRRHDSRLELKSYTEGETGTWAQFQLPAVAGEPIRRGEAPPEVGITSGLPGEH